MASLDRAYLLGTVQAMRALGVQFADGLSDQQLRAAEDAHRFRFPPDLRGLLQHAMPVGGGFPDWRAPHAPELFEHISRPAEGICFDIEHNAFWVDAWGPRPSDLHGAWARGKEALSAAPFLIPIYSHRYLPATPCIAGNPVLSVNQSDIIIYANDLPSYLFAEFKVPNPFPVSPEARAIEFWGELVQ